MNDAQRAHTTGHPGSAGGKRVGGGGAGSAIDKTIKLPDELQEKYGDKIDLDLQKKILHHVDKALP